MNIFDLARLEVKREGKLNTPNELLLVLERAIAIRKYLDLQERGLKISKSKSKKK